MELELIAVMMGLLGAVLIGLGVLMIVTARSRQGGEGRAYGVLLIGPLPILIKGRGPAMWIISIALLVLVIFIVIAALITIYGFL